MFSSLHCSHEKRHSERIKLAKGLLILVTISPKTKSLNLTLFFVKGKRLRTKVKKIPFLNSKYEQCKGKINKTNIISKFDKAK